MQDKVIAFPEPTPDDKAQFVSTGLPVSLTSLIGREQEVKAIHALLLCPDVRLLTITGTAGVGKTRLALEIARELVHDFADGVYFVSLAPISDSAFVIPTIAHSMGLMESGSQPLLELLKTSQRDKRRLLLLDNFEHVITAATLLVELLEACPTVKILVTSREFLRLRGEHQFAVLPLALPDPKHLPDDQSLAHVAAVHLFTQRSQAIQSNFQLTTGNATTIAEICLRLDGLPLAIELAAARIKLLPPQALLDRLNHRLHTLTGGVRDLPERQQTLRNTIQWSYDLLSEEEQRLFRRLAVFVGGCTLEAVEALYDVLKNGMTSVLDGVASLLDKSLLQHMEQRQGELRLMMLETLREYGLEALVANEEMEATRQAHAYYYLALAEEAEPGLDGPQDAVWLERLEREYNNLRAALQWSLEQAGNEEARQRNEMALRLGAGLQRFWEVRGHWSEGRYFLEQALVGSKGVAAPVQLKALKAAAHLAYVQGDTDRAEALSKECLTRCRELGDTAGIALSLRLLGLIAWLRCNFVVACSLTEESLALFREVGHKEGTAWALFNLATLISQQGVYDRAISLTEESLVLFRALGNRQGIVWSLLELANMLFSSQGDPAKVRVLIEKGLALSREVGHKEGMCWAFYILVEVFLQEGNAVKARLLLEEEMALSKELGHRQGPDESLFLLGKVQALEGDLAAARALYEESLVLGREMSDDLNIPFYLEGLAEVVAVQGEPEWAARLWGTSEALREERGTPIPPVYRAGYEHSVAAARVQLGEKAFVAAWVEGRGMTIGQAVAAQGQAILSQPGPPELLSTSSARVPTDNPDGLTPREMDVLRLLAQGLTSAQIAEQLVIGVVTVNFHVRSIYSKLGLTSRAAATRYALEHRLV